MFARRVFFALLLVITLFGVLIYRFYDLQVVHHENYSTMSDRNRIQVRPIAPNRGLVFDRAGKLIAENRPSFTLSLIRERVKDLDQTIGRLSKLIDIDEDDKTSFYRSLKQRRRPYEPVPLRYRLTKEEIAILAVDKYAFQGVKIEVQLVRFYPEKNLFAHTVGYVGRINEKELSRFTEEDFKRYSGTHSIGKIGIEKFYEKDLLGDVGVEYIEANAHGRRLRLIDEEQPEAGKDLHLFLDTEIQRAALKALGNRRGSLVAIEVKTGGVLAMVSTPSFNPNLFVTGISVKDYRALNQSADLPLFNRSIQGQYPPGSTLKPMLGLGALEKQIVDFETKITDPGYYQLENDERFYREWKKGGHGSYVNLHKAIVESCDIYFYDLSFRMGVDRMHEFGLHFGLGSRLGLDLPSERSGLWPSRPWKKRVRGRAWYPGNSLNMSIGQGDVLTTPLQLAVMTSTLASKGKRLKPRMVAKMGDVETPLVKEESYQGYDQNWDFIHVAMKDVVHGRKGTAGRLGRQLRYKIAGKTGTAQVVGIKQGEDYDSAALAERNRDHTLFIGFAPADNPEIALAVIIENGEKHSATTFPVVKAVFDQYFKSQKALNKNREKAQKKALKKMPQKRLATQQGPQGKSS